MTNIVGQLFKSLDPWPGFQITSFKILKAEKYTLTHFPAFKG